MKNYKSYPKYKDSGIPWLGEIPEHWETIRLQYLFEEQNDRSETGTEELLSVSHYTGVTKRGEKFKNNEMITNAATLIGYKVVRPGDLVMNIMLAWNGSLGVSKYYGITSPAYAVFKTKDIDVDFYHYLLRTKIAQQEFKKHSTGIIDSRLRLYPDKFLKINTLLPSIHEQTTIATFLDYKLSKINRFIRKKKELIKLLNEQKAAIINEMVTGRKVWNGNAWSKPDNAVEIDLHWLKDLPKNYMLEGFNKNVFLKHGFQFRDEHFSSEGTKVVKISQLSPDGNLKLDNASFVPLIYREIHQEIIIKEGDILMALTGGTIGKIIRANTNNEILLQNYRVGNFFPINDKLTKEFLFWLLKSEFIQSQMHFYVRETGQPNIGKGDFNKILLVIPPLTEQQQIVSYIEQEITRLNVIISKIEKEIALVEEFKAALIAEAVTGKIDVRDFVVPDSDDNYLEGEEIEEENDMDFENAEEHETIEE